MNSIKSMYLVAEVDPHCDGNIEPIVSNAKVYESEADAQKAANEILEDYENQGYCVEDGRVYLEEDEDGSSESWLDVIVIPIPVISASK